MDGTPHVGKEIRDLSNRIKRAVDECGPPRPSDLSAIQGWIMGYLAHNADKEIYQKDIEREFNIRRSTATGILQNMERGGYITRRPVQRDGRLKKLELSPKAMALHEDVRANINEMECRLTKGLSKEELAIFLDIVKRMMQNLEQS